MIKLLWRFALIVLLAAAFSWAADRPGQISIDWLGREIKLSVLTGLILLAILYLVVSFVVSLVNRILRAPGTAREFFRFRRQKKAYDNLTKGIIAAGAGDAIMAQRHALQARGILGDEPLVQLLSAQAAQLRGDNAEVKQKFIAMSEKPETEILGLRGLFAEAKQAQDWTTAKSLAERALAKNPRLPWASQALLQANLAAKDFAAAAQAIHTQGKAGLISKHEASQKRAIILTAAALAIEDSNSAKATNLALEAHGINAALVPAAAAAARGLLQVNQAKKALKVLKNTWAISPHPDLADLVLRSKAGADADAQFEALRDFLGKFDPADPKNIEAAYALARAAFAAGRFELAKKTLSTIDAPSSRIYALLGETEEALGDTNAAKKWLSYAVNAARDPIWVADGMISTVWTAISPITGEITNCEWKIPFTVSSSLETQKPVAKLAAASTPIATAAVATPPQKQDKPAVVKPPSADDPGIEQAAE